MLRFSLAALLSLILSPSSVVATPFQTSPVKSKRNIETSNIARLLSKSRPTKRSQLHRHLDEEEEQEIDLSGYSLKYVKCQFVKSYDDELAENEEAGTVLATNRFVIFRLCPSDTCSYNYGEYLVDMDAYLESALQYYQEQQEEMCNYCDEVCAADDDGDARKLRKLEQDISCDTCVEECNFYENMEDNGYVDASNFVECQQVADQDDDGNAYFAGAMCSSSGEKIKIGVFSDEECSQAVKGVSVEDYLEAKLSTSLLQNVYSTSGISCIKPNWEVEEEKEEDENGDQDNEEEEEEEEVEINEMCMELYDASGKCEQIHGFAESYANRNGKQNENYDNQAAQEDLVCEFIKTMKKGAYDETGEIILQSRVTAVEGATAATGGQKFALTVFILGTAGLAVYASTLHSQITKGGASGLVTQGGAMA